MSGNSATPGGRRPVSEIVALVRDLAPLARTDPSALKERLAALDPGDQAELALRLPAKERLELLLHAPKPMALVRSIPDAEVHLTVREVGPTDALPLLALASASQTIHLLDMEGWRGDRFDAERMGAWVGVLLEAGEATLRRFVRASDDETLTLLLRDWARVSPIPIDDQEPTAGHGETESGTELGFVSPDGAYRFSPVHSEHAPAVRRLAEMLFVEHQERYLRLMWAALYELPSELEEEALRWRASRLEEHGLPSWEEAMAVYGPPSGAGEKPAPVLGEDGPALAPRAVWRAAGGGLAEAVDRLDPTAREAALAGLAAVAGRVLVADRADTGDLTAHRHAQDRAIAYVGLALEARGARDASEAAQVLAGVTAADLFREGYAEATRLAARARDLVRDGWPRGETRAVSLLDAPLRGSVGALLQGRPLRFDPLAAKPETAVRDFRSMHEIREAEAALDLAERAGRAVVDGLGADVAAILVEADRADEEPPKLSALVLTAAAWLAVRGTLSVEPLPQEVAASFLRTAASRRTADPEAGSRAVSALEEHLEASGRVAPGDAHAFHALAAAAVEILREQCGSLDPGVPIPRAKVTCLRLAD